ncbi:MAG: site-specific integrase [Telluria sp.]
MEPQIPAEFERNYQTHLKRLKLKGMRPKTIDAYSRAIRRAGHYFQYDINALSEAQLTDYFADLLSTHSWSTLKHDLYGLKFYYDNVLHQPWPAPHLVKAPHSQKLPDIVTVAQMQGIIAATQVLSYRVFFYVLYALGLRLGEALRLQVADIDADRMRVQIRDAKGNKDRFVPLPLTVLPVLRRFWAVHRHPTLLFPNRKCGLHKAHLATSTLDRGGVQKALRAVVASCGIKKVFRLTACATVMPRT